MLSNLYPINRKLEGISEYLHSVRLLIFCQTYKSASWGPGRKNLVGEGDREEVITQLLAQRTSKDSMRENCTLSPDRSMLIPPG